MSGLRKHEPCPVKMMFYASPYNTICEVIRTIYHEAVKLKSEDIQLQARTALSMAKAMDSKLKQYNISWNVDFFDGSDQTAKQAGIKKQYAGHPRTE